MQQINRVYILDLPPGPFHRILALCDPVDLAVCWTVCKTFREASIEHIWQQKALERWKQWDSGSWTAWQQQGQWKAIYAARHQVLIVCVIVVHASCASVQWDTSSITAVHFCVLIHSLMPNALPWSANWCGQQNATHASQKWKQAGMMCW